MRSVASWIFVGTQEAERNSLVDMCKHIHQQAQDASDQFYTELGRRNYVTPTSFLELIQMFQKILSSKRAHNRQLRTRCAERLLFVASITHGHILRMRLQRFTVHRTL